MWHVTSILFSYSCNQIPLDLAFHFVLPSNRISLALALSVYVRITLSLSLAFLACLLISSSPLSELQYIFFAGNALF